MKKYIFITSFMLLASCRSINNKYYNQENYSTNDVIQMAIIDYSKHKRLIKDYNSYYVLIKKDSTQCDIENNICITISPIINKCVLFEFDSLGTTSNTVYNDFAIKKNKLFVWIDPSKKINQPTLEVMYHYDILDSLWIPNRKHTEVFITHRGMKEDRHYIFCKKNFQKFKSFKNIFDLKEGFPDCSK